MKYLIVTKFFLTFFLMYFNTNNGSLKVKYLFTEHEEKSIIFLSDFASSGEVWNET